MYKPTRIREHSSDKLALVVLLLINPTWQLLRDPIEGVLLEVIERGVDKRQIFCQIFFPQLPTQLLSFQELGSRGRH